jgi:hypothetical protein
VDVSSRGVETLVLTGAVEKSIALPSHSPAVTGCCTRGCRRVDPCLTGVFSKQKGSGFRDDMVVSMIPGVQDKVYRGL